MSGYRELYKELVPSQSLITDYLVKEKKITEVPEEALPCRSDDVILSSSDESDLAPIHKRFQLIPHCKAMFLITLKCVRSRACVRKLAVERKDNRIPSIHFIDHV
ncbi:hypothetical protein TNCV_954471 [Trichonephila clavipes]|nr:hypothetical protein TNCV_954471 [Trichonephila clavipes]